MLKVQLDIFSGRPNPYWMLSKEEESKLVDQILANPNAMLPLSADTGGLGYRGFIVELVNQDDGPYAQLKLPSAFRLGGMYDVDKSASLWLLDTSEKPDVEVSDFLRDVAAKGIDGAIAQLPPTQIVPGTPSDDRGPGQSCAVNFLTSDTDFSFWNGSSYRPYNNCYNYASNYRSNTFAQPGRQAGAMFTQFTCSNLGNAVRADGYADSCLGGGAQNISICLVLKPAPDPDFHFYRLCSNNHWCHKPGSTSARNTDNSGNWITSVSSCDRGPYTTVCEYFYANQSKVVN